MFILKQLRRKKNINQSKLAEAIGVSLRTIQLYERKGANIPLKNLQKLAQFFDLDIAQLYAHEANESNASYSSQQVPGRGYSKIKLGPGKHLLTVPLVTSNEEHDYATAFENMDWINGLPKIGFVVDQDSKANYIAFEITNNSMEGEPLGGIPQGAVVLGMQWKQHQFIKAVSSGSDRFWLLVCDGSILCKKVRSHNATSNTICCHSLNNSPEYPDFDLPLDQIKQAFCIIKKQID